MTRIALFSDGTGNSSSRSQKTNVWRAYQALDRRPESEQLAFYDNGVGTSSFRPVAILGLAFGFGLARNVRQIYRFLCQTYRDGDDIYGFGFSRGAFTMRVTAALICSQGIVNVDKVKDEQELDRWIAAAYHRFRRESFTASMLSSFLRPVRDYLFGMWNKLAGRRPYDPTWNFGYIAKSDGEPSRDQEAKIRLIKFIGVWDTVDAYGLPIDEFTRAWDMVIWPLTAKDRNCSPRIERACHALALDEQRESFEPALWNEDGIALPETIDDERVSQVWFAGVHSNVGGSYPDDSMALVPLNWMLEQSEKQGLTFLPDERQRLANQANWNGAQYDSRKGIGSFYRYAPRNLERLCKERRLGLLNWFKERFGRSDVEANEVNISRPKIHHSVFERIKESGDAYAPINLPENYAIVSDNGNIEDLAAAKTSVPETPKEADERRTRQAYLWNKVWALKLQYVLTFIAIVLWILYPYLRGEASGRAEAFVDPLLGTFSDVVRQIPNLVGKIPGLGFATEWAAGFASFPYAFIAFLVLVGLLWFWQYRTQAGLKSAMRPAWHHLSGKGAKPSVVRNVGWFQKRLAGFLDSRPEVNGKLEHSVGSEISRWFRIASEASAVVILIIFVITLVVAVISRIVLVTVDGFGGICEASSAETRPFGETVEFMPKHPCFDTGFDLTAGKTYMIDIQISNDWSDSTIYADVNGWGDISQAELEQLKASSKKKPVGKAENKEKTTFQETKTVPWYMYLAAPFRRHLTVGWYVPVATIDDKLFDGYPLEPTLTTEDDKTAARPMKLRTELKARRSGRLYLYLNDAVLFLPSVVREFYDNNNGCAYVTVAELDVDITTEPGEHADVACTAFSRG